MGSRTYLPTLIAITYSLCRYITRYDSTIRENLTTDEQKNALTAVNVACTALIQLVELDVNP